MSKNIFQDIDPIETSEWIDSIAAVIKRYGSKRAHFLIDKILNSNLLRNNYIHKNDISNFINTIHVSDEPQYPGNIKLEKKICSVVQWNAIMMVLRASRKNLDLGGHISSFQSSAMIYEVCFNHFFRASNKDDGGDLVYFQGHISPGIYSRAFLENRLTEEQMDNFRQETNGIGLSSYPHPKLMPNFWQFPTVSMGLSAISAIYQAKFLKYLNNRGLKDTSQQNVYVFLGDGEMDEPESKGAITIAAREKLDNLIFVVNCNLQRLDGPVNGNGKIINELNNFFLGAGWHVIKVIWGSSWDDLLEKDISGYLQKLMNETIDGDYQTFRSQDGAYIRKHFFNKYTETKKLVENMTDDDIWRLRRGGHDFKKLYSAFYSAKLVKDKPVVILIHTVKGYGLGKIAEGKNIAHQVKNLEIKDIQYLQNQLKIKLDMDSLQKLSYIKFSPDSLEFKYMHHQRKKLKGYIPTRLMNFSEILKIPTLKDFQSLLDKQIRPISTTIAFVRILNLLLKNIYLKDRIVPIVADEARTFGMEGLFRKIGIYNHKGQQYTPADRDQIFYYKEDCKGQILQEGINELGAGSSWLAAATSYSTNNFPMIPFYIYYSMFGFQRIGDLLWSCGDQQARGFLIGATSGRSTLNGEGLQHADGHSHVLSSTIPNCISYDPTYSYELAVIIQSGLERMYGNKQENVFFYITTLNESYKMPNMSNNMIEGICKGIYKLNTYHGNQGHVQLLGSGSILCCVKKAAKFLLSEYQIGSDIYSVTSFTELARNGQDCMRWNMLNPMKKKKQPYITSVMNKSPVVAATDYMKIFAEQIRAYIPSNIFRVLGSDGYGRSDSREKLRNFFEINTSYIVSAALDALIEQGQINASVLVNALKKLNIISNKPNPRLA
ncbi:pyruvate dehydrogenase (acetyl-transferring), homodimeric type [Buchnera aphidicola]|uniref:Pyruvate dehydrogenase E1 component n=1 Tax=Buchnera aphidicola (Cinara laricifoliae) TaxID=2518977 RepID=A0A451DBC2_9GAMM|nr:pyruvate dehydrogenase (acetyl-transferring), homodimeric type [Buchnera aphidicola]VFP83623.1 Pyruvate dehydrogenase E1 component [Buchnera aphidicola (Cinara laricifoliae)]